MTTTVRSPLPILVQASIAARLRAGQPHHTVARATGRHLRDVEAVAAAIGRPAADGPAGSHSAPDEALLAGLPRIWPQEQHGETMNPWGDEHP